MDRLIELAAPNGLGDAIYLRAAVLHLLEQGEQDVHVITMWPAIFDDLPVTTKACSDLPGKEHPRYVAYTMRHKLHGTDQGMNQFQLCCREAEIAGPVKLDIRWTARNPALCKEIKRKAHGREILIYQPVKLANIFTPQQNAFDRWLHQKNKYYRIRVGHPALIKQGSSMGCELDLVGKASVSDVFDIATIGDLFFGELCYIPLLAEAMDKQFVCMFSSAAAKTGEYKHINFQRMFHKYHLGTAAYDDQIMPILGV